MVKGFGLIYLIDLIGLIGLIVRFGLVEGFVLVRGSGAVGRSGLIGGCGLVEGSGSIRGSGSVQTDQVWLKDLKLEVSRGILDEGLDECEFCTGCCCTWRELSAVKIP